jgi:hypothetical protein
MRGATFVGARRFPLEHFAYEMWRCGRSVDIEICLFASLDM